MDADILKKLPEKFLAERLEALKGTGRIRMVSKNAAAKAKKKRKLEKAKRRANRT